MTWDRQNNPYLLKFHLNLHKKFCGIPSGANLNTNFLQDKSAPIFKKNVLSVACQFYNPTGLAAPLMFSVRSLFSEIFRDCQCSMNSPLSDKRTNRFCTAVNEILLTRTLSIPRQIIFNYAGQIYIFFDCSLQGYGCLCLHLFPRTIQSYLQLL